MQPETPRSIAVIDVGSTNTKLLHFSSGLKEIGRRIRSAELCRRAPYLQIDTEAVIAFATAGIRDFDHEVPVDAIVTSCHGSALALLDASGELALPVMSYLAEVPDDVARAYAEIEPVFEEVLAPTNPLALTLGRQLLWQEMHHADAFARVTRILPLAQYIGFRLTGVAASEVSSLGAQTHLWAPRRRDYASLARARGWAERMAPIRPAADVLGPARGLGLDGHGAVHCGVHDSNANYLRYKALAPVTLLSTGTWIIAFDSAASVAGLEGRFDQVSNTTVSGEPVASARFMGGEEYARIAGAGNTADATLKDIAALIASGVCALPSFTDSGGPAPGTGGQGRIAGGQIETDDQAASLAALYTAQMTALMVERLGATRRIVVDGVFVANAAFLSVLAALLPDREILRSFEQQGTATGAASLALAGPVPPPELEAVKAADLVGLGRYQADWRARIGGL